VRSSAIEGKSRGRICSCQSRIRRSCSGVARERYVGVGPVSAIGTIGRAKVYRFRAPEVFLFDFLGSSSNHR